MSHGRYWLIGAGVLVIAALVGTVGLNPSRPVPGPGPGSRSSDAAASVGFRTLPPGSKLPSGAQCARWVRAAPSPEIRPSNEAYNQAAGQHVGPELFPRGDAPQAALLAPRISGEFTGTTQQILEWAACKWGISQDIVFAQAAAESTWRQNYLGDWGTEGARCPPGYGTGADGRPGECPQSVGILQTKYLLWKAAWPGLATSTAMNADVAYAIWRSCFDGYEIWLENSAPRTRPYHAGDLWGCVGRWFAGSWYTPPADRYIGRVKELLRKRVWIQPSFLYGG